MAVTATFLFMPSDFADGGTIRATGEASFAGIAKPFRLTAQARVAASYLGLGVLTREVVLQGADLEPFKILSMEGAQSGKKVHRADGSLANTARLSTRQGLGSGIGWPVFAERIRVELEIDVGLLGSLARIVDLPPGYDGLPHLGSGEVELAFYCERLRPQNQETA